MSQGSLKLGGFMPGNKCKFQPKKKVMFVIMYVTGSTGKTEDRSKFLTKLDLFKKYNITTVFMKKKNGILHLHSKIN